MLNRNVEITELQYIYFLDFSSPLKNEQVGSPPKML